MAPGCDRRRGGHRSARRQRRRAEPARAGDRRAAGAGALAYLLLAGYSASVALRRRLPAAALALAALAGVAYAAAQYPEALTPVGLLPVYTAAAVLPARRSRLLLALAVVLGWLGTTFGPGPTDPAVPAVVLCAWLLGSYVGSRRAYTAELERQTRLLEQAQLELADRAVARERLRIARELHDVVAHTMTVVAMHAGTGRMVAESDPAAARQALATVETASVRRWWRCAAFSTCCGARRATPPGCLRPPPGWLTSMPWPPTWPDRASASR